MVLYFDTNIGKRQTEAQLNRRGLFKNKRRLPGIGILKVDQSHNIDTDLYVVTDSGKISMVDDRPFIVYEKVQRKSNEAIGFDIRQTMKGKIHTCRDTILAAGLPFTFDGADHVLQTRDAVELVNWMNTYTTAQSLPEDTPIKVRTEADKTLFIPAGQMVALLGHMVEYRTAVMDASWEIKDSIDGAATDAEAFTAYESGIETAWPDPAPFAI